MSYNYAINQIMILCEKINQKCNTKIQCIYYTYLFLIKISRKIPLKDSMIQLI